MCECVYRIASRRLRVRPRIVTAPCRTTYLPAGSGVGGFDGSPSDDGLVVLQSGDFIETWFSNFTIPEQEPDFVYNITATSRSVDVEASLKVFSGLVLTGRPSNIGEEGEYTPDDYDYDPTEEDYDYDPGL